VVVSHSKNSGSKKQTPCPPSMPSRATLSSAPRLRLYNAFHRHSQREEEEEDTRKDPKEMRTEKTAGGATGTVPSVQAGRRGSSPSCALFRRRRHFRCLNPLLLLCLGCLLQSIPRSPVFSGSARDHGRQRPTGRVTWPAQRANSGKTMMRPLLVL
jgi:hypothetical protein